jgi:hypothetical protein
VGWLILAADVRTQSQIMVNSTKQKSGLTRATRTVLVRDFGRTTLCQLTSWSASEARSPSSLYHSIFFFFFFFFFFFWVFCFCFVLFGVSTVSCGKGFGKPIADGNCIATIAYAAVALSHASCFVERVCCSPGGVCVFRHGCDARRTNELEMENQNIGDRSASIIKPNRLG